MEKRAEAQVVYEELVVLQAALQELADNDIVSGRRDDPLKWSAHLPDGRWRPGMDRGLARWTAARRRLDAKGGVLRCADRRPGAEGAGRAGRRDPPPARGYGRKVRAEWEAWLKLAAIRGPFPEINWQERCATSPMR